MAKVEAAQPPVQSEGEHTDTTTLRVDKNVLDRLTVVKTVDLSLTVMFGEIGSDRRAVLFPCVHLSLTPSSDNDGVDSTDRWDRPAFSELITLDNACFIMNRMSAELSEAYGRLTRLSKGGIKLAPDSEHNAAELLQKARDNLEACVASLGGVAKAD